MNSPALTRFLAILTASLWLFVQLDGTAANPPNSTAGNNNAPPPKADKKARGLPFHGNVAAVDRGAKSVTMEGKKQRVFFVTSETKINRETKPSKLEALAVGDYVGGYAREAPDGKLELVTLNITPQSGASKSNAGKGGGPPKTAK